MKFFLIAASLLLSCNSVLSVKTLIVAHRGASKEAPENTIPAFELAWEQGADAIEGDFQLTSDGAIVCIHDPDTKRVSGKKLIVSASSLSDLRKLDVGSYRGPHFRGALIPTIQEVFSTIPEGKKIYIEIKSGVEIITRLLQAIDHSGLEDNQIVVISFNRAVIQEMKAAAPQYKACWLSNFEREKSGKIKPSLDTVLTTLKQINADGFSSTKKLIDEAFISEVIKAGYEYHVWTVNDLKTAKRFKSWGADSITTDVPGYIQKNLSDPGAPSLFSR